MEEVLPRSRLQVEDVGPDPAGAGLARGDDHLAQLLDTGDAPTVAASDPKPLEATYAEAFGLPVPTEAPGTGRKRMPAYPAFRHPPARISVADGSASRV